LEYAHYVNAPIELMVKNFATPSHLIYWLSNVEVCSLGIKLWSNSLDKFICD
jgi:hypothetical protein